MSNFLNRLTDRSRGTAETMAPRVPSFYEPYSREAAGNIFPEVAAPEKNNSTTWPERDSERAPAVGSATQTLQDEGSEKQSVQTPGVRPAQDRRAHDVGAIAAGQIRDKKVLKAEFDTLEPAPPSAFSVAQAGTLKPLPARAGARPSPALRNPDPTSQQLFAPARAARNAPGSAPPGRPEISAAQPQSRPQPPLVELPAAATHLTKTSFGLPARRAATVLRANNASRIPGPGNPAAGISKSSEQTVHVTIGRVEVRAIHSPAPAQRTAAPRARSTVSLDDYLKGSTRGRR